MGFASVRDALAAVDPDRGRLLLGARASAAAALAAFLLSRVAGVERLSLSGTVLGAMVAMLGTALVADTGARAQRITSLLLLPTAALALVAGTLAAPHRTLRLVLFVGVMFAGVLARRFGPRGTALGILSVNSFFFALYFQASVAELPWLLGAAALGAAVAFTVRFGLLRDRVDFQVRSSLGALRVATRTVLARIVPVLETRWEEPPAGGAPWLRVRTGRLAVVSTWRLRRAIVRLNEVALVIEELLQRAEGEIPGAASLRESVFELEVAASRVAVGARTIAITGVLPAAARSALTRAIALVCTELRGARGDADSRGAPPGVERLVAAVSAAQRACAGSPERRFADVQIARLSASLQDLLRAVERLPWSVPVSSVPVAGAAAARVPVSSVPVAEPNGDAGLHPSTRQAIQTAVAGGLAIVVGFAISRERWFWAVLAAFIVLTRATTRGEIAVRAWHRTVGTVLGVVLGILLAAAVHGHPLIELGLLFVCVFLAFYWLRANYAWMVAWLTAALAILYSLMGRASAGLFGLRIAETMAGAAIGTLVAALVLPTPTGGKVRGSLAGLLRDFAAYLDLLASADGKPERLKRARSLDQQLRDLRSAAAPLTKGLVPLSYQTARLVQGMGTLVFYARQLADPGLFGALSGGRDSQSPCRTALSLDVPRQLAENARALAERVDGGRGPRLLPPVAPLLSKARAGCAANTEKTDVTLLLTWFLRMDETLREMSLALGR